MKQRRDQLSAVFLDKDGTLIRDVPYNVDPRQIELLPRAAEGAMQLAEAGYALIIVSNQSGVARDLFPEKALAAVEQRLRELLAEFCVPLAGFYYCPHHPQGANSRYAISCRCRKPAPGMLLQAARKLSLDLNNSWLIGDILDDVEAGHRAGCRAVLIDNGHERKWQWNPLRRPDFVARDLMDAAQAILGQAINLWPAEELVS